MTKNYITKIKANISVYTSKKSGNVLDGSYVSVFRGRSMNFEDLREYIPGDSMRDIDWKASSRSGTVLVKRYIAEKKHNMMFVLDTGKKMMAQTPDNQSKKEVALYTFGTLAYIAQKNGDQIGAAYIKDDKLSFEPFRTGMTNIERLVSYYESYIFKNDVGIGIGKVLNDIMSLIRRRMVIFVITDMKGAHEIEDSYLKKLRCRHDVLFAIIEDMPVTSRKDKSYDLARERYIPAFITADKRLMRLEKERRLEIADEVDRKLTKNGISYVKINSVEAVNQSILDLLERHKHVNNH